MKTAISIPNDVFRTADMFARRFLTEKIKSIDPQKMKEVEDGLRLILAI